MALTIQQVAEESCPSSRTLHHEERSGAVSPINWPIPGNGSYSDLDMVCIIFPIDLLATGVSIADTRCRVNLAQRHAPTARMRLALLGGNRCGVHRCIDELQRGVEPINLRVDNFRRSMAKHCEPAYETTD